MCVTMEKSEWPGLNSDKKSQTAIYIQRGTDVTERTKGFETKPQFYLSNVHEMK